MSHEPKNIIENFYEAFCALDAERMVEWYHTDVTFEDPAFGVLKGEQAKNMWRMLCESQQGKNFTVKTSNITYQENKGLARWEAYYVFGKGKRKVHNVINAEFQFKDGKIINHIDKFNLYKWAKQAIGFKGFLVGWTTYFKRKLHKQTNQRLMAFEEKIKNQASVK